MSTTTDHFETLQGDQRKRFRLHTTAGGGGRNPHAAALKSAYDSRSVYNSVLFQDIAERKALQQAQAQARLALARDELVTAMSKQDECSDRTGARKRRRRNAAGGARTARDSIECRAYTADWKSGWERAWTVVNVAEEAAAEEPPAAEEEIDRGAEEDRNEDGGNGGNSDGDDGGDGGDMMEVD